MGATKTPSLLAALGAPGRRLKRQIAVTAFISRLFLFLVFFPLPISHERRRGLAIRLARLIFPYKVAGQASQPSRHGQVFVINHPTLNDPLCAIAYALGLYPGRKVLIPVNLPWYEGICKYRGKLQTLGVNIVPILTPETAKRLGAQENVASLQRTLMSDYMTALVDTLAAGGVAVVAQQATRRRHVFCDAAQARSGKGILATVSFILAGLRRAKLMDCVEVVPLGVVPHRLQAKARLNPFCRYTLCVDTPILAAQLGATKNAAKRPADFYVLQRLTALLPKAYHFA
ncbi:MAG: hypothetical protein FWG38_02280 [Defluviitaleaceae bacterium]|nr:hypothetical protein [Defluviitaleaceae bacterium]